MLWTEVGEKSIDETDMQQRASSQKLSSGDESKNQPTSASAADGFETVATHAHSDVSGQSPGIRGQQAVIGLNEGLSGSLIPTMQSYMDNLSAGPGT